MTKEEKSDLIKGIFVFIGILGGWVVIIGGVIGFIADLIRFIY